MQTLSRVYYFPSLAPDMVDMIRFIGMQENIQHTRTLAPTFANQLALFRQELEKQPVLYDANTESGRLGSESKDTSKSLMH